MGDINQIARLMALGRAREVGHLSLGRGLPAQATLSAQKVVSLFGCLADGSAFIKPSASNADDGYFRQRASEQAAAGTLSNRFWRSRNARARRHSVRTTLDPLESGRENGSISAGAADPQ